MQNLEYLLAFRKPGQRDVDAELAEMSKAMIRNDAQVNEWQKFSAVMHFNTAPGGGGRRKKWAMQLCRRKWQASSCGAFHRSRIWCWTHSLGWVRSYARPNDTDGERWDLKSPRRYARSIIMIA